MTDSFGFVERTSDYQRWPEMVSDPDQTTCQSLRMILSNLRRTHTVLRATTLPSKHLTDNHGCEQCLRAYRQSVPVTNCSDWPLHEAGALVQ